MPAHPVRRAVPTPPPPSRRPRGSRRAAALLVLVAACAGERAPVAPGAPRLGKGVTASETDVTLLLRTPSAPYGARGGTTRQLDAVVTNPRGKPLPHKRHTTWTSLDTLVVTVDSTGRLTAQGVGRAAVVVDHKRFADTVQVEVAPVPVRSVTVAGADSIGGQDTTTFAAAALDSAGAPLDGRSVAWNSLDSAVAAVSAEGAVVGRAAGAATITATVDGVEGVHAVRVWPQPVASVAVAPSPASVPLYRPLTLVATPRDRRGTALTDRAVAWRSSDTAVATVSPGGVVTTMRPGTATVTAASEGHEADAPLTVSAPVEARALWITRFDFNSEADVVALMHKAATAHFNIVYFQARAAGDAFYTPRPGDPLEPCAYRICTPMGAAAVRYDPLAVAVREGQRHGIQVHAWLNSLTGWISGTAANCALLTSSLPNPEHMVLAHPEWVMTNAAGVAQPCATTSEYIWVSPGWQGVRARVAAVAADLARRYAIHGVHLDRIRYPGTTWSYDTASVNAYRRANGGASPVAGSLLWADFRRELVNATVHAVRDSLRAVDPRLVLSAAVWPTYSTVPGWTGSYSKGYDELFQDPRAWAERGDLDVAAPMTYPGSATSTSYVLKPVYCQTLDWLCLFDEQRRAIEVERGRHVYIGVGAIRGWEEMRAQIAAGRARGATGFAVYSASLVNAANAWPLLAADPFRYPAVVPPMPWK